MELCLPVEDMKMVAVYLAPGVVQQDKSYLADIFLNLMTWLQMTKDKKPSGFNIQIRGIKIQMQFHRGH